jgi:hypothetical protein
MLKTAGRRRDKACDKRLSQQRVRTLLLLVVGLLLVWAAPWNSVGQARAEENFLVKIAWKDGAELSSIEGGGCVLRYCQPGWAIFEITHGELENLRSTGASFDVIDTMYVGKRYWLLTPAESSSKDSLAAYGKLVSLNGDKLYLFGVDEVLEPRLPPFVYSLTLLPERFECRTFPARGRPPKLGAGRGTHDLRGVGNARFAGAVSSEVSIDSIKATVHFLSFDDDSGKLRSRFTFRPDSLMMPGWLMEKLEAAMGGRGTASLDSFVFRYGGRYYTRYNVVGRVAGRMPGSGTFVLCAHYDSQAGRTVYSEPGRVWHWQTDPAPGADDNGSGVASVLECARALNQLEFDFDVEFVLFCAEEQGLFGSNAYVESRKAQGTNILGALNLDMHAYRETADTTFLRTNPSSDWLSNHIRTISETLFDSIGLRVGLVPEEGPYGDSDHASFWMSGFDAVHFFEQGDLPIQNPYYHTINDTAGTLNYVLAWKVAKLAAASMTYFSTTSSPWDLEVLSGDLELRLEGHAGLAQEGSVGDVVNIVPSFHNLGAGVPDTDSVYVSVYDGSPSSGWLIGQRLIAGPIPSGGSPVIEPFTWLLTEGDVGAHSIYLVVDAGETEQNRTNNAVSKAFHVASLSLAIRESFVFPNPSNIPLSEMRLRIFVTRDAALAEVDIYDISGRRVGGCRNHKCGYANLSPGDNDIRLSDLLSGTAIAPGVYLYRLSVGDGAQKDLCYGRFAVVR